MKTRPWPLVILAVLQILTPLFNILFNAYVLKVNPVTIAGWVFEKPPIEIFEYLFLMPIAGIAIYLMKKWSYAVFFFAMFLSILSKAHQWNFYSTNHSRPAVALVYLLELLLVLYFLTPEVRTTYFDPSVRWWESKPRYELKIPASLQAAGRSIAAKILNISEGGTFIQISERLDENKSVKLQFDILGQVFMIDGEVVHHRSADGNDYYGIRFNHTRESEVRFQSLVKALTELGFRDERYGDESSFKALGEWAVQLFKTGKGWLPETSNRRKG